jgi:3'-phosphoadenosine 5'-phosphosulfate sulfotransferase (PAPS reductase)/FAD synthetase
MSRVIVWVSAGAASAVAARITLAREPATLAYIDPGSEHADNARFLDDLEKWYGQPIQRIRSSKYEDTWQVWRERRFLNSPRGALCTTELKKRVRQDFTRPDDVQVFGYTVNEQRRADRFTEQNPEIQARFPLIDHGLTKTDCLELVARSGIEIPAMYRLGYANNNCIGCVKGGAGYWNQIRRDFPETFARMAALEREIGATVLRADDTPLWLDELDPERGRMADEPMPSCSLFCEALEL